MVYKIPFAPLAGPLAHEWYQWLLLDLVGFSLWVILGGFFFGATAWSARQHGDKREGKSLACGYINELPNPER